MDENERDAGRVPAPPVPQISRRHDQKAGVTSQGLRTLSGSFVRDSRPPSLRIPMKILTAALLAAALAACSGSPTAGGAEIDRSAGAAQCLQPAALTGTPDPRTAGRYIVVFRDGTDAARTTQGLAQKYGFEPRHVYEHALQGFSAALTDAQLAGVRCEAAVKYVSHDGWVSIGG